MRVPEIGGKKLILLAGLVILTAVAVYGHTLRHGFAFDDVSEVVRNEHIRSLSNVIRIFSSGSWEGAGERNAIYRPLATLTYAVNYSVGGLSPAGYHVVNLLLHALASVLVLALSLRLGVSLWPAAAGALIFAAHPIHVEVVANIAGRKDSLAAVFVLFTVITHGLAGRRGGGWLVVSPLALGAALLSKESGVAALGLVLSWDVLFEREFWARRRSRYLVLYSVYAAELAIYLWARHAAVGSLGVPLAQIPVTENPAAHASAAARTLTAVAVLGRGLLLMAAPFGLSPDYSFDAIPLVSSGMDPRFLASASVLAAIAAGAVLGWRRSPAVTFAVLLYAFAVFPASNLLVPIGTIFGERLLYLPSVGFCIALSILLQRIGSRGSARVLCRAASIAATIALSVRTISYASVWSDEVSLFRAAVRSQPRSGKAHELLGAALMEQERFAEGVAELEKAVQIMAALPGAPLGPLIELGVGYERSGRFEEAAVHYERVLQRRPELPDALWRLGVVRWSQGRRQEALELWQRAVAADPGHARALSDLGTASYAEGDLEQAESFWRRAIAADPQVAGAWLALGNLYERRGEPERARSAWARFLENARYGVYTREREIIAERLRRSRAGTEAGGPR